MNCLAFCNDFRLTPFRNYGFDQIQRWKSPLQKPRGDSVIMNKYTWYIVRHFDKGDVVLDIPFAFLYTNILLFRREGKIFR